MVRPLTKATEFFPRFDPSSYATELTFAGVKIKSESKAKTVTGL
jgi:hypothetical protein